MNPHELWRPPWTRGSAPAPHHLDDAVAADATFTVLMGEKVEPEGSSLRKKRQIRGESGLLIQKCMHFLNQLVKNYLTS